MRTAVSILCFLSVALLLAACNSGSDNESSGGTIPVVSFEVYDDDRVECYNADRNVNLGSTHICEWNCATFATWETPANWTLYFDLAPELTDPDTTADYTYTYDNPLPCK